jgi:hypothetical protein
MLDNEFIKFFIFFVKIFLIKNILNSILLLIFTLT